MIQFNMVLDHTQIDGLRPPAQRSIGLEHLYTKRTRVGRIAALRHARLVAVHFVTH